MSTIVLTGANRGLGLGLVRKLLSHEDPPAILIATYRDGSKSGELLALAKKYPQLRPIQLEMTDLSSFDDFADEVDEIVGDHGLNVLINNAGIARGKDSIDNITAEDYMETYLSNVLGPVFLIKALLPLIRRAADAASEQPMSFKRAAILNISSALGSVSLRHDTRYYSYRESKAALNTFTRNIQYDLKGSGILVLPIHPGWVRTDMGGPEAHLSIEESVNGMISLFYSLEESQNGQFIQWDGEILPW